jgi:formylglycine-generating enzyme required for sulfatase activity
MTILDYKWQVDGSEHTLQLVEVPGTNGRPYLFGRGADRRPIEVPRFYIATAPVTQALWLRVMGANPAKHSNLNCPVENFRTHPPGRAASGRQTQARSADG